MLQPELKLSGLAEHSGEVRSAGGQRLHGGITV